MSVKIGDNLVLPGFPLSLAPMEDVSDPPFRAICKENGADLLYTEFISGKALIHDAIKARRRLDIFDAERPVAIQIFGGDEDSLAQAAAIVETTRPDFLDINFGCPVKGIVSNGAGAGVLRDIDLMVRLTAATVRATALPVTVKTRLGWDDDSKNIEDVALRLQDTGIKALAIHGRTRCQLYKGEADWTLIGKVKNNPHIHIPIFGNGDIDSPEKALEYKNRYGVDGIMIGRAAIGHPWIFREVHQFLDTGKHHAAPTVEERIAVCRRHLHLSLQWKGMPAGLFSMRGRYAQYLRPLPDIKPWLKKLVLLKDAGDVETMLDDIAKTYKGLTLEREPIRLVNYHENCAL